MRTLSAGTIVALTDNRQVDIKEYMKAGMYLGHDCNTGVRIYFGREEVVKILGQAEVDSKGMMTGRIVSLEKLKVIKRGNEK